ncbi:hypothetical protein NEUTE2DRAFT_128874 [Neurospora tetrasperma FGSC 2509]|nr:hypothetical protein NEUTE2DRAFT_128874 [Neurospora tetrasperma FGSC 2509]
MTTCYPDISTKFKCTSEALRAPKDSLAVSHRPIPEVPHVFWFVQQNCASSGDMSPRPSQNFRLLMPAVCRLKVGCALEIVVANPGVKCCRSGEE